MAISYLVRQCFQMHLKYCHSGGGPGGDEARPGITKCLKLVLTQTAQDKPFYLFLSRVLIEH